MRTADASVLAREFSVFCAYLGAADVRGGAEARYVDAHATMPTDADRFDRWLVAFARLGVAPCSLADAYARRARPYGALRRKLTLVLALLEMGRSTHSQYDRAVPASPVTSFASLIVAGSWWGVRTVIALAVVAPLHFASIIAPDGRDD